MKASNPVLLLVGCFYAKEFMFIFNASANGSLVYYYYFTWPDRLPRLTKFDPILLLSLVEGGMKMLVIFYI